MIDQVLFRGAVASLDTIAIGASRIAGPPDLPAHLAWPIVEGVHLPLVLQLALGDIAGMPAAARLPADGTLYFFGWQAGDSSNFNDIPAAILHAPPGELARAGVPPEATTDPWASSDVARITRWLARVATDRDDEPRDDDTHVLFPVPKYSVPFGDTPPAGFIALLEMRSDYAIGMNWGDAAWATWVVPADDLVARRFDRATANVWIG